MSPDQQEIAALEDDFLAGKLDELKDRRCPRCGGRYLYSVYKAVETVGQIPGRRFRCGISIYCIGVCNTMVSHLDGFCPAWAESVSDWSAFSNGLYGDDLATILDQDAAAVFTTSAWSTKSISRLPLAAMVSTAPGSTMTPVGTATSAATRLAPGGGRCVGVPRRCGGRSRSRRRISVGRIREIYSLLTPEKLAGQRPMAAAGIEPVLAEKDI